MSSDDPSSCHTDDHQLLLINIRFVSVRYDDDVAGYILKHRLKLNLRWLAMETFCRNPKLFSEVIYCVLMFASTSSFYLSIGRSFADAVLLPVFP